MRILTFDIEEWFHLLDNSSTKTATEWVNYECRIHNNMDRIFELLDKKQQKATFFCLGWVAQQYPDVLKRIDSLGHEIACHSNTHQLVYESDAKWFFNDTETAIKSIEDVIGKKVTAYRAPGFSITEDTKWAFDVLYSLGIEQDSSVFPTSRAHGGFPSYGIAEPSIIAYNGIQIKEYPINLASLFGKHLVFSGGGYFRLLPYSLIRKFTKKSDYVLTYFHPRDFDPDQPMIKDLSAVRKFKSYYGLSGCLLKLDRLLTDFEFVDLATADAMIDWGKAKVVQL